MDGQISGKLFTGLGEGARYISMDHYSNSIENITGYKPFPGTLNLYVEPEERSDILEKTDSERIEEEDDYIGIDVHKVKIAGFEAAVLDLDLTDHGEDVIEIVAPVELRDELDLEDGDAVQVNY